MKKIELGKSIQKYQRQIVVFLAIFALFLFWFEWKVEVKEENVVVVDKPLKSQMDQILEDYENYMDYEGLPEKHKNILASMDDYISRLIDEANQLQSQIKDFKQARF